MKYILNIKHIIDDIGKENGENIIVDNFKDLVTKINLELSAIWMLDTQRFSALPFQIGINTDNEKTTILKNNGKGYYKLLHTLWINNKAIEIYSYFKDFKEVISVINSDLNSLWNNKLTLPIQFSVLETNEKHEEGKIVVDGIEHLEEEERGTLGKMLLTREQYLTQGMTHYIK